MYGKVQKWFWISVLHDNKRDILLNGMILLSGTHRTIFLTVLYFIDLETHQNLTPINFGEQR